MAVEKTLRLESTERFPLSPAKTTGLWSNSKGLLRREEGERTVQRNAGLRCLDVALRNVHHLCRLPATYNRVVIGEALWHVRPLVWFVSCLQY